MNKINRLSLMACAMIAIGGTSINPVVAAGDKMMLKEDAMSMEKSSATDNMQKMDKMEKAGITHEVAFSAAAFAAAQASGQPFLVAFHKKGCPLCASQKQALNAVYANPQHKGLKVLVVDYDNDTASLKKFNVGMQGTLILYKGNNEMSRSDALVKAADIEKQLQG